MLTALACLAAKVSDQKFLSDRNHAISVGHKKRNKRQTVECAECGSSFSICLSRSGLAKFCSRTCQSQSRIGKSYAEIYGTERGEIIRQKKSSAHRTSSKCVTSCPQCGKQLFVSPYRLKTSSGRVSCSRRCSGLWIAKDKPKAQVISFTCRCCGKMVTKKATWAGRRQFCSRECSGKSNRGEKVPRIDITCAGCQQSFRVRPCDSHRRYCSISCYDKSNKRPNGAELKLSRLIERYGFDYVADDPSEKVGRKHPDFVSEDRKSVIELFGERWHDDRDARSKREYYARYGMRCLIIWVAELKHPDKIHRKVQRFINNIGKPDGA